MNIFLGAKLEFRVHEIACGDSQLSGSPGWSALKCGIHKSFDDLEAMLRLFESEAACSAKVWPRIKFLHLYTLQPSLSFLQAQTQFILLYERSSNFTVKINLSRT